MTVDYPATAARTGRPVTLVQLNDGTITAGPGLTVDRTRPAVHVAAGMYALPLNDGSVVWTAEPFVLAMGLDREGAHRG